LLVGVHAADGPARIDARSGRSPGILAVGFMLPFTNHVHAHQRPDLNFGDGDTYADPPDARTIATMKGFTAGGSVGQAAMIATNSGSLDTRFRSRALYSPPRRS
jgi:hypothetical protein